MCKAENNPINLNLILEKVGEDVVGNREMHQCLVGRLIYLSHTKPDIMYAISMITQLMHNKMLIYKQLT